MRFMNGSLKKFLFVAISGMSLLPAPTMAQDASGKFTLTREVRWGTVLLPPGGYSYSVEHHGLDTVLVRSSTGGPSAIVLATSVSTADSPAGSRLVLERHGEEWFVALLVLGSDGQELHFTAPPKETEPAQAASLRRTKMATLSNP